MISANAIAWDDNVLPFQLDNADVRGRIARLDNVLVEILDQHNYPKMVESLVAEAAMLTALIGQTIDLRWKLSLQVQGSGPVSLIATDYFAATDEGKPAKIRAYAGYDPNSLGNADGSPFTMLGEGMFAILIDQGSGQTPYQGITPLAGGSLAACAETYFAQSEQLPTRFSITTGSAQFPGEAEKWRAGGLMVQHMPKASPEAKEASGEDGENWQRVNFHIDTIEPMELVGPHIAPSELLFRLFHEETPRVFESQPIRFGCTCNAEKVEGALADYSKEDINDMADSSGKVTADCQFCGVHYEFESNSLGK